MNLMDELKNYTPFNKQEKKDVKFIIDCYRKYKGNIYTRDNKECHITSACWILSPDRKEILMAYHNIYKSFSWLGGHADGDTDLVHVTTKELKEESGVKNPKLLFSHIFSVEVLTNPEHIKNGKLVKPHKHLNITYLFEVDESETLRIKEDENSAIRWIKVEDIDNVVNDKAILPIYHKLIQKVSHFSDTNYYDFMKEFLDDNKERI